MTTIKRCLAIAVALFASLATPVLAQTPGTWTVGDQGKNWSVDSTLPTGSAPADAYEPAEVPLPGGETEARWKNVLSDQLYTSRCTGPQLSYYKNSSPGTCDPGGGLPLRGNMGEKKIRLGCAPSTAKRADNILGHGIRYFGHGHQGYGSIMWDAYTTFATLRANPRSTCQGMMLNASNYMEPALVKPTASGALMSRLAQNQAVYYVEGIQSEANTATWLRRGMAWVWSSGPGNYNDTKSRAEYAAGGLNYPGSPDTPAGVIGWYCDNGDGVRATVISAARVNGSTELARYLKGPDGSDSFGGTCNATGAGPATLTSDLLSQNCWDRINLTAGDSTGSGHMAYSSRDGGTRQNVCPKTSSGVSYARVPQGEVKNIYYVNGFSDYGDLYFTSDRMRMPSVECPDATNPCDGVSGGNTPATVGGVYYSRVSLSACRSVSLDFCNGETLHADYTFGWFSATFETMERECLGITTRGVAPVNGPAECNAGIMDRYSELASAPPAGAEYWTGGCTTSFDCRDSIPGKPSQAYAVIEGMDAGTAVLRHSLMSAPTAPKAVAFNWGAWLIILIVIGGSVYMIYRRRQQ